MNSYRIVFRNFAGLLRGISKLFQKALDCIGNRCLECLFIFCKTGIGYQQREDQAGHHQDPTAIFLNPEWFHQTISPYSNSISDNAPASDSRPQARHRHRSQSIVVKQARGFSWNSEDVYIDDDNTPKKIRKALDDAVDQAKQERKAELKQYDLAVLGVSTAQTAAEAKKIVEEVL